MLTAGLALAETLTVVVEPEKTVTVDVQAVDTEVEESRDAEEAAEAGEED